MKYTVTLLLAIFSIASCNAQALKVEYTETMDLSKKLEGIDDPAIKQLVLAQTGKPQHYELISSKGVSLYREQQQEQDNNGNVKVIREGNIVYKNHKTKQIVKQSHFMSRTFLIEDKLVKPAWQLTNETIKIGDYVCKKALLNDGDNTITAWFTEEIPSNDGPQEYFGLPGLIMKVKLESTVIEAVKITPLKQKTVINPPVKGKKVTQAEYNKIVKEKTASLGGKDSGNGVKIIRMN